MKRHIKSSRRFFSFKKKRNKVGWRKEHKKFKQP
jgi:hypothetical protein